MRFTPRTAHPGETRWGIFQNIMPRETPEFWYFNVHAGPLHFEIFG